VKDLDFERLQVNVYEGKGDRDRRTMLPKSLVAPLQQQLDYVRIQHDRAMNDGFGGVELPHALSRKYPNAEFEMGCQYVFPASTPSRDPRSGKFRRHHCDRSVISKSLRRAALQLGLKKHVGPHTLRHSRDTYGLVVSRSGTRLAVRSPDPGLLAAPNSRRLRLVGEVIALNASGSRCA
jgi:integrase